MKHEDGNMNDDFRARLKNIPAADFDGHTNFQGLTPDQKLEWLSGAVQFYFEHAKRKH